MDPDHPSPPQSGPIEARIRLWFHEGGTNMFGPGTYRLLVNVREVGSLHRAAQIMGMSYSKAWRIVRQAEEHLGVELLERHAGGAAGGGSVLTAEAHSLIERFGHLQDDLQVALDVLFAKYFADQPYVRRARRDESESAG
jgi:molybdate transport system regulatory protein